ncbi:MAG: hypothetical protein HY521_09940 [Proteobacteria bacterium]|nr:hypothetical protein [Pseudomonadota bacterium]
MPYAFLNMTEAAALVGLDEGYLSTLCNRGRGPKRVQFRELRGWPLVFERGSLLEWRNGTRPKGRKPGRPRSDAAASAAEVTAPVNRKRGRPKRSRAISDKFRQQIAHVMADGNLTARDLREVLATHGYDGLGCVPRAQRSHFVDALIDRALSAGNGEG